MKRLFLAVLFLSLFGLSSNVSAYDTCDPANPFVPCTYNTFDHTSYIGNDNQGAVFFNINQNTIIDYNCYSNYTCIDFPYGGIYFGFDWYAETWYYQGGFSGASIPHEGYTFGLQTYTGYQELGGGINPSRALNITRSPTTGGGISDYPAGENIYCGIDGHSECSASFPLNTEVTLDASPNEGYGFRHWKINGAISPDTDGSIDITMSETKNVEAVYVRVRYPVDYTPENPNGWSSKLQSFGSLNNVSDAPHAAEDWNKDGGDIGQRLYSIADGVVVRYTEEDSPGDSGWGETILLKHDAPTGKFFLSGAGEKLSTIYSQYAHMLKSGQHVSYNQDWTLLETSLNQDIDIGGSIGQVGNGDGQYGSHLDFEILTNINSYRDNPYAWSALSSRVDPSELINNGLYSDDSTEFSIIVHPYECSGTFRLNDSIPNCDGTSSVMGNWTRRGNNYSNSFQLGYGGIIYSKVADNSGTVSWKPNLPKNGQYRVLVYVPKNNAGYTYYATATNAIYTVSVNGGCYQPQTIDQSAVTDDNRWIDIGTYDLYQYGSPMVSLEGDTGEEGKSIAADAVKFEYVGAIQQ